MKTTMITLMLGGVLTSLVSAPAPAHAARVEVVFRDPGCVINVNPLVGGPGVPGECEIAYIVDSNGNPQQDVLPRDVVVHPGVVPPDSRLGPGVQQLELADARPLLRF